MTLSNYLPGSGTAGDALQANVGSFTSSQEFTISGRFRRQGTENTNTVFLMGRALGTASGFTGYRVQHTNNTAAPGAGDGLKFILSDGTDTKQITGRYLEIGVWHHLAFVKRGSGDSSTLEMYVDGVRTEETIANSGTLGEIADATARFRVFDNVDDSQPAEWDMADLQIWDTDLSAAEVLELYNDAQKVVTSGLAFVANLDNEWDGDPDGNWPNVPALTGGVDLVADGTWSGSGDPVTNFSPPDHVGLRFAYNQTSASQYAVVGVTAAYNAGTNRIDVTMPAEYGGVVGSYMKASGEYVCPENFVMRVVMSVSAVFTGGVGLVTDEGASSKESFVALHFTGSEPDPGIIAIYGAERTLLDDAPAREQSATATAVTGAGNLIEYTIIRCNNTFTVTCQNLTNPTARPVAYLKHEVDNVYFAGSWDKVPATAVPAIWCLFGSCSLVSQELWSLDVKGSKYLVLGDSLATGLSEPDYADGWISKARANLFTDRPLLGGALASSSGSGDTIATVDAKIDSGEIEAYAGPDGITLLLDIGASDILNGTAAATVQADHEDLLVRLNGLSYVNEVILFYVTPMAGDADIPTFNAYLATRSERKVNTNTPFLAAASTTVLNAAYDIDDGSGRNFNAAGFTLYASTIRDTLAPVEPSSIASGEAFGTAAVSVEEAVDEIAPSAIASAETFGTAALIAGAALAPSSIASAEAFGTAAATGGAVLSPSAIASAETFGTAALTAGAAIAPSAIASGEAFGAATLAAGAVLTPSAIASSEAFGTAAITNDGALSPSAIASGEAFGTAALSHSAALNVVFDGNSLVAGAGATAGGDMPSQTVALLAGGTLKVNVGIGGQTIRQMMGRDSEGDCSDVDGAWVEGARNVLVVWESTNAIFNASRTAVQTIADTKTYISDRLWRNPWTVVLVTSLPRNGTGYAAQNAVLSAVDADMVANYKSYGAHAVADVRQAGSPFDFAGDADADFVATQSLWSEESNPWVHLTNAGYAVVAGYVAAAIESVAMAGVQASVEAATPTKLVVTFSDYVDDSSVPVAGDFSISNSGGADTVLSVAVVGKTVELTKSRTTLATDTITVGYTKPGSGMVRSLALDEADTFSGLVARNNVGELPERKAASGWFDPESNVTIVTGVSQWVDRIASLTVVQATEAQRPAFNATAINGHPGLTFTRADSQLLTGAGALASVLDGLDEYTLFVVASQSAPVNGQIRGLAGAGTVANTARMCASALVCGAVDTVDATYRTEFESGTGVWGLDHHVHTHRYDGVVGMSYVDGALTESSSKASIGGTLDEFVIGATRLNAAYANHHNGSIGDIIVVPRALPPVERAEFEAFLALKYADEISPSAIASSEAFGTAAITAGAAIAPSAVASGEAFGTAALVADAAIATPSIASGEAFGAAIVSMGGELFIPSIASAEAFGTAALAADAALAMSSIASAEAFGTAALVADAAIAMPSIASGEAFGAAIVADEFTLVVPGIESAEAFGAAEILVIGTVPAVSGPRILVSVAPLPRTLVTIASAPMRIRGMTGIESEETFGYARVS